MAAPVPAPPLIASSGMYPPMMLPSALMSTPDSNRLYGHERSRPHGAAAMPHRPAVYRLDTPARVASAPAVVRPGPAKLVNTAAGAGRTAVIDLADSPPAVSPVLELQTAGTPQSRLDPAAPSRLLSSPAGPVTAPQLTSAGTMRSSLRQDRVPQPVGDTRTAAPQTGTLKSPAGNSTGPAGVGVVSVPPSASQLLAQTREALACGQLSLETLVAQCSIPRELLSQVGDGCHVQHMPHWLSRGEAVHAGIILLSFVVTVVVRDRRLADDGCGTSDSRVA